MVIEMLFKRIISLVILTILFTSCSKVNQRNTELNEVNDNGTIVFRAMFFEDKQVAEKFTYDSSSVRLNYPIGSNEMYVFAKKTLDNKSQNSTFGYQIGGTHNPSEKLRKLKEKHNMSFFVSTVETPHSHSPEFFYNVISLPAGDYYINKAIFNFHKLDTSPNKLEYQVLNYSQKESDCYFTVEANKINYLGDLYFTAGEPYFIGMILNAMLLNKSSEAENFMKKFYPQLHLPFIENFIRRNP